MLSLNAARWADLNAFSTAATVEFLTKLTSFWQRAHRARSRPPEPPRYWNINEASGAAAAAAVDAGATPPQRSIHGKRRTEAALLMDSRRRPRDKFPEPVASAAAEAASSSSAVSAQSAAAGHTSVSVEKTVLRSGSLVHDLRMAASAYASRGDGRPATAASGSTKSVGARPSASPTPHIPDVSAVSDDFTLDGVHVREGEIVAPTLRSVAESKSYHPASGLAEIDLFVLFELVTRRWNGFSNLSRKQWIDVLRQLMLTERIVAKQHLFQTNDEQRILQQDEEVEKSPAKKGRKSVDELPAQLLTQSVADELCAVYRTHLLPYEQYVTEHAQQQARLSPSKSAIDLSKPTSMDLDDDDSSATTDEPKVAAAASSSSAAAASAPCIARPASHSCDLLSVPAPTFSMFDIRQWSQVRAMKARLQAQRAEPSEETRPLASAAAASGSRSTRMGGSARTYGTDPSICAVCKNDTLAAMCQCHHCLSSQSLSQAQERALGS